MASNVESAFVCKKWARCGLSPRKRDANLVLIWPLPSQRIYSNGTPLPMVLTLALPWSDEVGGNL